MTIAWACLSGAVLAATDVGLAGVFPGKALLTINGGAPQIVLLGTRTASGVKVVSMSADTVIVEVDGRQRSLRLGQNVAVPAFAGEAPTAVMTADALGHFLIAGSINGTSVRFIVDTGASTITLGGQEARRLGIDASSGTSGTTQTANGVTPVRRVRLDTVKVGDIVLNSVDATILEHDMPFVLLGMSFLNRMEMQRNGSTMTLKKNY